MYARYFDIVSSNILSSYPYLIYFCNAEPFNPDALNQKTTFDIPRYKQLDEKSISFFRIDPVKWWRRWRDSLQKGHLTMPFPTTTTQFISGLYIINSFFQYQVHTIGHVLATVKTQIEIFLAEYWCSFSSYKYLSLQLFLTWIKYLIF